MAETERSGEWCVVDLETTGMDPGGDDRIVEAAFVVLDSDGDPIEEWHSLVNPKRDVGSTSIHGITDDMAGQAPDFLALAGDILERLHGRRLVGHNVHFDCRFLEEEFRRIGISLGRLEAACTMQAASRLGIGRSLETCCLALEIEQLGQHSALGDAIATGALLKYLLGLGAKGGAVGPFDPMPAPLDIQERVRPSGRTWPRTAASDAPRPRSYLARLSGMLPTPRSPEGIGDEAFAGYLEMLDRVMEDRIVTDAELGALAALANDLGLGQEHLERVNRTYLRGLVSIALEDEVVTDSERQELDRAAALLGIQEASLEAWLEVETAEPARVEGAEFTGLSVCFSGPPRCLVGGERLSTAAAGEAAKAAGLEVAAEVGEGLDLLVVVDAEHSTGRARSAREQGVRVIAEREFWPRIGVAIDAR